MPLAYNPGDKIEGGGRAGPGEYTFVVHSAQEVVFRSGSSGLKVQLSVGAFKDRDVTVFENFVYHPKSLWRLQEFLESLGLSFDNPPEPYEIEGKVGRAVFEVGERGYLQSSAWIPTDGSVASNRPAARTPQQPMAGMRAEVQASAQRQGPPPARQEYGRQVVGTYGKPAQPSRNWGPAPDDYEVPF